MSELRRAAAAADLIVLAEVRVENGEEVLVAVEVLKGTLGDGIGFKLGERISGTHGSLGQLAGEEGKLMLYYQKRFGSQSWLMTSSASGDQKMLAEELRKTAIQPAQPTPGS